MVTTATTRTNQETTFTPTLFLAFELGVNKGKLGFTTGAAQRPRERHVPAGVCGRLGEHRGESPLPPGENGSPGWVQAAHDAPASYGWGKEGLECGTGLQRGRGRPPPAASGTPDHEA
jgi:hypothetical protein